MIVPGIIVPGIIVPRLFLLALLLGTVFLPGLGTGRAMASDTEDIVAGLRDKALVVAIAEGDVIARFLFEELAREYGLNINYEEYPISAGLPGKVINGKADFTANITYTPEREKFLEFSPPCNTEPTYFFSKQDIVLGEASRIGVRRGTVFADLISRNYPDTVILEYAEVVEAIKWLETGRVDGVVGAIIDLPGMLENHFYEVKLVNDLFPVQPVSIVAAKGKYKQELRLFSEFAQSENIRKNLRQLLYQQQFKIRKKALRKRAARLGFTPGDRLSVKLEMQPPLVIFQENGTAKGITADALFESCELLEFDCQMVNSASESWSHMYQELLTDKIDVLASMVVLPRREEVIHLSDAFYSVEGVIARRTGFKKGVYKNVTELFSERIGVVREDFFHILFNDLMPEKELFLYETQSQLIEALESGEIDYAPFDQITLLSYIVEKRALDVIEDPLIGQFSIGKIALGFAKSEKGEHLAALFSEALNIIDTHAISERYRHKVDWQEIFDMEKKYALQAQLTLVSGIGVLVMVVVVWIMRRQSRLDKLTGLRNRRALHSDCRRGLRTGQYLLYLDLNKFKDINDVYGHEVGDQVLQRFANLIRHYCQGNGYRIGGDEFVVVGRSEEEALLQAVRDLERFGFVVRGYKMELEFTASIGVFLPNVADCNLRELLVLTDMAMYQAKRDQSQQSVVIDSKKFQELQRDIVFRQHFDLVLKQHSEQLQAEFLQISRLESCREGGAEDILAFECRVLWENHGFKLDYSSIKPHADFFDCVHHIDLFAIRQCIALYEELLNRKILPETGLKLILPLSKQTLGHLEQLLALLRERPQSRHFLVFIVDESEHFDSVMQTSINLLSELGYRFAMGNFGATYSPLKPLQSVEFIYLKTNAEILLAMKQPTDAACDWLGLLERLPQQLIVDGVDSEAQLSQVKDSGFYAVEGEAIAATRSSQEVVDHMAERYRE